MEEIIIECGMNAVVGRLSSERDFVYDDSEVDLDLMEDPSKGGISDTKVIHLLEKMIHSSYAIRIVQKLVKEMEHDYYWLYVLVQNDRFDLIEKVEELAGKQFTDTLLVMVYNEYMSKSTETYITARINNSEHPTRDMLLFLIDNKLPFHNTFLKFSDLTKVFDIFWFYGIKEYIDLCLERFLEEKVVLKGLYSSKLSFKQDGYNYVKRMIEEGIITIENTTSYLSSKCESLSDVEMVLSDFPGIAVNEKFMTSIFTKACSYDNLPLIKYIIDHNLPIHPIDGYKQLKYKKSENIDFVIKSFPTFFTPITSKNSRKIPSV